MKKKISLLLCLLVTVFCFTACGSNTEEITYNEAELEQVTEFLINYCSTANEETLEQWNEVSDFAIDLQLIESGIPFDSEVFLSVLDSWQSGLAECGAYVSHGEFTYQVTGSGIEASAEAQFEERDGTIVFVFDETSKLESMTVSASMSVGELLQKAGLNTILGMGITFCVLILIAFIISLFRYIPKLQEVFSKKGKAENAKADSKEDSGKISVAEPKPVQPSDEDHELIAVIAAAIAAVRAEAGDESGTDGFVVRSIRRRPSNKWNS